MKVELQKWKAGDTTVLQEISNHVNRTYISGRLPYPYTEADAKWWIDKCDKDDGSQGIFRGIVVDGRCVGNISVERKADVFYRDGELGYLLLTDYWSGGIVTEAVRQICGVAFAELELLRITANVYSPNIASRRVLEKNGFTLEGVLKHAIYKNNEIYDLYVYGKISKEETV